MRPLHNAIVWIDHREAKVYRFSGNDESTVQVNAHHALQRLHHRPGGWEAGGNPMEDGEFFGRVAGTLEQSAQILVTGPGDAKSVFKTYLDNLEPHHTSNVFTLEMTENPGEDALLALARERFHIQAAPAGQNTLLSPVL